MGNIISYLLDKHSLTHKELADNLSVSTNAVQSWSASRRNPSKSSMKIIQERYAEDLADYNRQKKGGQTMDNMSDYVIELQRDKIRLLEEKVQRQEEKHSASSNNAEAEHWDGLNYHYRTEVSLRLTTKCVYRTIDKITDIKAFCDWTGYSLHEVEKYWAIGQEYVLLDHPMEAIVTKETSEKMKRESIRLPSVLDAVKSIVGDHYIPFGITWIKKDGSLLHSISYNKIHWRTKKIYSKVEFLSE